MPQPSAARLLAALLAAVERDDPAATLLAAQTLANRLRHLAAAVLIRVLLSNRHQAAELVPTPGILTI